MTQTKKFLTIEHTIHFVMIAFALASVGNVAAFFRENHHDLFVSYMMATALGTAVATSAIMLTKIDMVKQWHRFVAVALMVLALSAISGFVQMQGYLLHGLSLEVSLVMGFGIVFCGECLTAIALSLYNAAERRRMIDEADSGLELKLAETFAKTLSQIDTNKSAEYMQQHVDKIIRYKVHQLAAKYVPGLDQEQPEQAEPPAAAAKPVRKFGKESLPIANEKRSAMQQERHGLIRKFFAERSHGRNVEIRQYLEAKGVQALGDTIRKDLNTLGASFNNGIWSMADVAMMIYPDTFHNVEEDDININSNGVY